jgi:hypothetical protein
LRLKITGEALHLVIEEVGKAIKRILFYAFLGAMILLTVIATLHTRV